MKKSFDLIEIMIDTFILVVLKYYSLQNHCQAT